MKEDIKILEELIKRVIVFKDGHKPAIGEADQLTYLRDRLSSVNYEWDQELTQHLVTLDSASTFLPKDENQKQQTLKAIKTSIEKISELANKRIEELKSKS